MSKEKTIIENMWETLPPEIKNWIQKSNGFTNLLDLDNKKTGKIYWKITLYHRFFNTILYPFKGDIPSKVSEYRNLLRDTELDITVEKLEGPLPLIVTTHFSMKKPSLTRRQMFKEELWDAVYFFPTMGLVFHSAIGTGTTFPKIAEALKVQPIRIRALENSKLYNSHQTIRQLRIATIQEIAGFVGLDYLEFCGQSVKEGLKGLQIRQEIKVNLENMGPKLIVATDNLILEVGKGVKFNSLEGVTEFHAIL